jgi:UDP-N-acetylglucosamine--N-acetylmuramyl-(pentapeptide) pyrophosphoryl-undecaprenol N-acetylglucosamine transferase
MDYLVNGFEGSKIYFSTCGIGLGHVSRSVPIAQEVVNRGGHVMFSTYLEGIDYVKKFGFPVVRAPPIHMVNDQTGSIDLKSTTASTGISVLPTFLEQVLYEIQWMQSFKPDLVFSDSRLSSIYAAKILRVPIVLILNQFLPRVPREKDNILFRVVDGSVLTLLGRSWALSNLLIIPDFPEPYTISVDSLRIPRRYGARVQLVGSILQTKPHENNNVLKIRENLNLEKGQKLIYAAISGPKAERLPLIRLLEPIFRAFPERYKIVMSLGTPRGGSTPLYEGSLTKIPWIENRFEYLNACDLVISRGGHETIMQSVCYQKPSVIIPVPKHPEQYGNARRAVELGVASAIHQEHVNKSVLLNIIDNVVDSGNEKKRLREINSKVDLGEGLERTLESMQNILKKHKEKGQALSFSW